MAANGGPSRGGESATEKRRIVLPSSATPVKRCVRTPGRVTGRCGKPHPEQDQQEGSAARADPRVVAPSCRATGSQEE